MGRNVTQQLIEAHLVSGEMRPGEEVGLAIDQTLTQDATGTLVMQELEALDLDRAKTEVSVQYVGVSQKTKKQFDASWDRGQPFSFVLGQGNVIPGWDQGVPGMKVGGRRKLVIPAGLAYGAQGAGDAIGPNEALVFVVDLVAVNQ